MSDGAFLERLVVEIVLNPVKYLKGLAKIEKETERVCLKIDKITQKAGQSVATNLGQGFSDVVRTSKTAGQNIATNIGQSFTQIARQAKMSLGNVKAQLNSLSGASAQTLKSVKPAWAKVLPVQAPPVQSWQAAQGLPAHWTPIAPPVQPNLGKIAAQQAKAAAAAQAAAARVAARAAAAQAAAIQAASQAAQNLAAILSVPAVMFGRRAISEAVDFSDAIVRGGIAAGVTASQMDQMRAAATQMSKDMGMSATAIAQTFGSLIRGGLDFNRVLGDAGEATAMLAEIGGISTEQAASSVVKILTVFQKESLGAEKAVNILSAAADASVISINDMMLSMAQGAAMAAAAGQTYEDTATVIAMLGQAGIVASDAGTSMKVFFQRLTDDDAPAKLKSIGVEALDAAGNVKPLRDLIASLSTAIKGMPSGKKLESLTSIFGTDATRVALVLGEQGTAAFDKMRTDMQGAMSVTEKYAALLNSIGGQWRAFLASVERFAIVVGSHLVPVLQIATDLLERMMAAFERMSPEMQRVSVAVATLATGLGIVAGIGRLIGVNLLAGVMKIGPMLAGGFQLAVGAITAVVAALGGPLTAAIAIVAAALAGLTYWIVGPEGIAGAWNSATEAVGKFFENVYGFFYNFRFNMEQLWSWFKDNWKEVLIDIGSLIGLFSLNMMHNLGLAVHTTGRIFLAIVGFIEGLWSDLWTVDFWVSVGKGLKLAFTTFIEWLSAIADAFSSFINQAITQWAKILTGGSATFDISADGFGGGPADDIAKGRSDIVGTIKGILEDAMGQINSPFAGFQSATKGAPNLAFYTSDVFGNAKQWLADTSKIIVQKSREYGYTLAATLEKAGKMLWNNDRPITLWDQLSGSDGKGLEGKDAKLEAVRSAALANMGIAQTFTEFRNQMNAAMLEEREAARKTEADNAKAFARLPDAMVMGSQEAANAILRSMAPKMPDAKTEEQLLKDGVDQHRKANKKLENIDKNLKNAQVIKWADIA